MARTHVVPTHLKVPETVLTIGGLNLSVRQFFLLLLGLALGYQLWSGINRLLVILPVVVVLRWIVAAIPVLLSGTFAFVRLARRSLDAWCLVLLRYHLRPRLLVWRSIRYSEPLAMTGLVVVTEEEEAA